MARSGTVTCANGNGPLAPISMVACIPRFLGSVARLTCHSVFPGWTSLDSIAEGFGLVNVTLRRWTINRAFPTALHYTVVDHYDAALVAAAGGGGDGTSATGIQKGSDAPTFGPLSF